MNFGFSEDQDLIRKSARDFVGGESSLGRIRELREDERGYSTEVYQKMADNGWLGCVFPEAYGGIGLGYVDLICIEEEFGRGLMPEPLITSSVLAGNAILFGGSEAQKLKLLPEIAAGESLFSLGAYELNGRYDHTYVETTAEASGSAYVLNGKKSFVADAAHADKILVTARTSGDTADRDGVTLFLLDRETKGLTLSAISTMDCRSRSMVELNGVDAGADRVVGEVGGACAAVEAAIDRATIALCAEMVGGMEAALEATVSYAQERVQFGKPIGSFQAVKHKCANMYVTLETARSAMHYAAMAADQEMPDLRSAISAAKTLCSDGFLEVSKEAIQLHGGIGFTDEHDIHFFYKRAMVANATFGDGAFHRERYARENGFGQEAAVSSAT